MLGEPPTVLADIPIWADEGEPAPFNDRESGGADSRFEVARGARLP